MQQKSVVVFLLTGILVLVVQGNCGCNKYCKDWTVCQRVRCAAPPNPCPKDKPYLLYGECGCCQYCSETPRIGPCGKCRPCKEAYPICEEDQIVSIDYCGCCRVCKSVIGLGGECTCRGPSFSVCAAGLECRNGTCVEKIEK